MTSDSDMAPKPGAAPLAGRRRVAVVGLSYPYRGGISHYSTLFVRALRGVYEVSFITLRRQYPGFLFPGQTQFDFSANTLVEPNTRIIDTLNPLTWLQTARVLNREQPELIVFQWWHPFFAPCFGTIVRLLGSGFPDDSVWDPHYLRMRASWERALARLKVYLEKHMDKETKK